MFLSIVRPLVTLAGRLVRRSVGPLHRSRAPRHGPGEQIASPEASATWWGGDDRWFPSGTPPRAHNSVTALVDGERFLAALHEALVGAREYVYVAGWCLTPDIPLLRAHEETMIATRLLDLLSQTAARVPVRVLLWSGTVAILQPTTKLMEEVQTTFAREGRGDLRCVLDRSAHFSHCHHQKAIVVDGQVAFVGGMDLTTFSGDRWDTPAHALRAGPELARRAATDRRRGSGRCRAKLPRAVARDDGRGRPPPPRTGVRVVMADAGADRTHDPARYLRIRPAGEFGIHHAYLRAIRRARRLIYLENQYLWSPVIVDALIAAMDRERDGPFRIVIVLPAHAYDGKWDNDKHVQKLQEADKGRGMVSVYSPYTSGPNSGRRAWTYRPVYVHAKVGIFDDEWFTVGSANLNNRGLVTDSEMNAVVCDTEMARDLRIALWAEHLALPRMQVAQTDPIEAIDRLWVGRAAENARIIEEATRPLICAVHPYTPGQMPGAWLLEEVQALTLEH